ncbi:MAG: hypothetical protein SGJ19_19330 [Planctomycetia bacterium]|nr:hypothetical protein [Planctomycetia bacterium]
MGEFQLGVGRGEIGWEAWPLADLLILCFVTLLLIAWRYTERTRRRTPGEHSVSHRSDSNATAVENPNPYRSPQSSSDSSKRFIKSRWFQLSIRAAMALVGIVVVSFGTLIALGPQTSGWFVLPAAICLVCGGACLIWWASREFE